MTYLTDDETYVLRFMLGLTQHNKETPTRNRSHGIDDKYFPIIKELQERDYVTSKAILDGIGARRHYYLATPSGIEAVRDQSWK